MFRHGARTFATCARRMADAPSPYTIAVSKAQGIAHGLVGGMLCLGAVLDINADTAD
jgi:hypothetical protein